MERREINTPAGPMSVLAWDAPAGTPNLHFAHATGMNAQLYAGLLAPLTGQFRIIASDARGHGFTRLAADPDAPLGWDDYATDLLGLIDTIDPDRPWLLAGHSMGATVSLLAAGLAPARVAGLMLADPAMLPFDMARQVLAGETLPNPMADQALRRRGSFPSRAEARAAYHGRGVFRGWSDADLDGYLAGGLVDSAEGVALACTPAWESATFRAVSPRVEAVLAGLERPFALIAGEHGSTVRDAELDAFAAHPRCVSAQRLAGTSHFVPLERGDTVRAAIMALAG